MNQEIESIYFNHRDEVTMVTLNSSLLNEEERTRIASNYVANHHNRGIGLHTDEGFTSIHLEDFENTDDTLGSARQAAQISDIAWQILSADRITIWDSTVNIFSFKSKMSLETAERVFDAQVPHNDRAITIIYNSGIETEAEESEIANPTTTFWPSLLENNDPEKKSLLRQKMLDEMTGKSTKHGEIKEIIVEERLPDEVLTDEDLIDDPHPESISIKNPDFHEATQIISAATDNARVRIHSIQKDKNSGEEIRTTEMIPFQDVVSGFEEKLSSFIEVVRNPGDTDLEITVFQE